MLPEIRIASPCSANWESMTGDDQSRHCSECNRNVYNFSEMTAAQIGQLIAASNGERLCGRLYRRADGTILTSDCPVGLRARIRRVSRRVSAALAAAMSFVCTVKIVAQQDAPLLGTMAVAQTGFNLFVGYPSGDPIVEAQVSVVDLKSGKIIATGKTDATGKYGLALAQGDYRLLVQKAGLVSQSVPVSITQQKMQRVTVKLQNRSHTMGIVAITPTPMNVQNLKQAGIP